MNAPFSYRTRAGLAHHGPRTLPMRRMAAPPGSAYAVSYRNNAPPYGDDDGLGWIGAVVMAVVTIAHKLYTNKRAKDKRKRQVKLDAAEATKLQDQINVTTADLRAKGITPLIDATSPAPSTAVSQVPPPLAAGVAPGGHGVLLAALGIGAVILLTRKARR